MNGLEKILKDINDDAQAECDNIINQARQKADEIIKEASAQVMKNSLTENEKLKNLENDLNNRIQSAARLEKLRIILSEKQKIISDIINKAYQKLLSLPDKEYFNILMKLAERNIQNGNGEIVFNEKDKNRLPKDFIFELNEKANGSIILSNSTANIDGGFILVYGGIEENCSFDSIFHSNSEEFKDTTNKIIFNS